VYTMAYNHVVVARARYGGRDPGVQGGIMETSDIYVVNKMDHDGADRLVGEIESMLDLADTIEMDHGEDHVIVEVRKQVKAGLASPVCKDQRFQRRGS